MKVYEALNSVKNLFLNRAGSSQAAYSEAVWLLTHCMDIPSSALFMNLREPLPASVSKTFLYLAKKRASGFPLQYLTGSASFFGRDFLVTKNVLIPREDTGALIEAVLRNFKPPATSYKAADAGCGTGIIAITLILQGIKPAKFELYDISSPAIACAKENIKKHGLNSSTTIKKGDFFALTASKRSYFDLIVSNPPYIKIGAKKTLQKEVLKEPSKALFAGKDGLLFYRKFSKAAPGLLKKDGMLAMEIGAGMEKQVLKLFKCNFELIESARDTLGKMRALILKLKAESPSF